MVTLIALPSSDGDHGTFNLIFGAVTIYLIVSGMNGLVYLRSANWRPWLNPQKLQTHYPISIEFERSSGVTLTRKSVMMFILYFSAGIVSVLTINALAPANIRQYLLLLIWAILIVTCVIKRKKV